MDLHLAGKVAMISGAGRGLGYAVALGLAAEGCRVSISSLHSATVEEAGKRIRQETGAEVLAMEADVRSEKSLAQWHRATLGALGGVDLLYPNGGGPPPGEASSFDDAAWQSAFDLLILSVVRMVRLVAPSMAERGGGSIVIPTSSSVKQPIANLGLSNVLRAAVGALAKSLATELAPKNIRVNHLIPGRIATQRVAQLDDAQSHRLGISIEEQRSRQMAKIPMGRYGEPEDLARAAVFLFSDASQYITGATLQVDGGMIQSVL